ncbi:RNA-directed DNA polymerase, eukaryota, reverse transcriptase zinc-binding domain protein [Tanacetum coccineum]
MYVDGGSASEILYEHCFNRHRPKIKNQLVPATTPLIGFSGEIIWPIGQIQLLVRIGDEEHSASAWMNFVVVRSPSPYNGIGRPGVRKLQAYQSPNPEVDSVNQEVFKSGPQDLSKGGLSTYSEVQNSSRNAEAPGRRRSNYPKKQQVGPAGIANMSISHLMYADDIIFFGDWSWVNAHNLISMLRCFFLISGLKINIHKSHVLGVGVTDDEVSHMANIIGCGATNLPLKYLGVPLLSVGGRLSLIKSVLGNLPTYYMSIYLMSVSIRKKLESMRNNFFIGGDPDEKKMTWVKWDRCLASRKDGGLSVESIFGLNIELLFKWVWSTCGSLISSIDCHKRKGIDLFSLCTCKIGNGADSSFWKDTCIANRVRLQDWSLVLRRQPRGGVESFQYDGLIKAIDSIILTEHRDSWQWASNSAVKQTTVKVNLDNRGILSIRYNVYLHVVIFETVNRCFFNCLFAKDVWSLLAKWWEFNIPVCDNIVEWFAWLDSLRVPSNVRMFLEGVEGTLMCEELITLAKFYPNEFSINELSRLSDQLDNYIHDMRKDERFIGLKDVGEFSKKLVELKKHTTFDLVYLLIKLVLILPVATASVERTFSAMTFVKNKLRNSIGDQFLNDCLVTYVEKDIFSEVSDDAIMNRF